jgi:hypothetical protein
MKSSTNAEQSSMLLTVIVLTKKLKINKLFGKCMADIDESKGVR